MAPEAGLSRFCWSVLPTGRGVCSGCCASWCGSACRAVTVWREWRWGNQVGYEGGTAVVVEGDNILDG